VFRRAHWAAPSLMRPRALGPHVLLYHNVEDRVSPFVRALGITLSPRDFESHVRYLKQRHHVIPFSRIDEHRDDPDAVVITFDDACKSFITDALPIIERLSVPVKLFIAKDLLGGIAWANKLSYLMCNLRPEELRQLARDALDWSQNQSQEVTIFDFVGRFDEAKTPVAIDAMFNKLHPEPHGELYMSVDDVRRILDHSLIEFGSHTRRHYPLSRLSSQAIQDEVVQAHHEMNAMFEGRLNGFCIPFGFRSELTRSIVQAVAQIDEQVVSAYGGRVDGSMIYGRPEIKRTGVWGNVGVLWHRMRWPT